MSAQNALANHELVGPRRPNGLLLGVVGALILGAAVTLILLKQDRPPSGWTNIENRKLSVSAEYPNAWHLQRFDHELGLLAIRRGIVLSNVRHQFRYPDLGPYRATSAWNMRPLPSNSVVIEISQTLRFPMTCGQTEHFPLALENGQRTRGAYGSPARLFLSACIEGKPGFDVHVWIWPDASSEDRKIAREIVSSIHPAS